jgi:hypothetical protein
MVVMANVLRRAEILVVDAAKDLPFAVFVCCANSR